MAMTKADMRSGLLSGKSLTQNKDCSSSQEISDVEELVTEGAAVVSDWTYGRCRSCGFSELQRSVSPRL